MSKSLFITSLIITSGFALANNQQAKIVYGVDDRLETYEASTKHQELAQSTAGMIESKKLVATKDHFLLPPASLKKEMNLCEGERFANQPSSVICSGFLVAPDLLVTAGHCVANQARCEEVSFVFDYKLEAKSKRANMMISKDKVYRCQKVIDTKLEGFAEDKRDYALIKLDRIVPNRKVLKYRDSGRINNRENLVVIGHPSGLPQKVADGAQVIKNLSDHFFQADLDTFGGNSGSAVINEKTGEVEGILVRGAKDYVQDPIKGCIKVNTVPQEIKDFARYGESVSRITDIPTLKYRSLFLKAASNNDYEQARTYSESMATLGVLDNEYNTAMHLAAKTNNIAFMRFLMDHNLDINAQNARGETALHIAAFYNAQDNVAFLLNAGADPLIKDRLGAKASDRTKYMAFRTRKMIKRAESNLR